MITPYQGISIPLHIMGSQSHCIAYQGSLSHIISILLHIMGSQSHCIAYQDLYPTSHLIPGSSPISYHEIFISMHISIPPSIASLHSSNPTNTSSYP